MKVIEGLLLVVFIAALILAAETGVFPVTGTIAWIARAITAELTNLWQYGARGGQIVLEGFLWLGIGLAVYLTIVVRRSTH